MQFLVAQQRGSDQAPKAGVVRSSKQAHVLSENPIAAALLVSCCQDSPESLVSFGYRSSAASSYTLENGRMVIMKVRDCCSRKLSHNGARSAPDVNVIVHLWYLFLSGFLCQIFWTVFWTMARTDLAA